MWWLCVSNNRTQQRDHQPNNRALSVGTDNSKIYGYKADGPVIYMLRENRTGFVLI